MPAERLSRKQAKRGVKKVADRNAEVDSQAIYLREDSNEFITRYIEPELLRAYGAKTLQHVGVISFDRDMGIYAKAGVPTKRYEVSIERDLENDIPFTVQIHITEAQKLRDEELLVQWPLLEKSGLADVLKDAFFFSLNGLGESDLEDFTEGTISNAPQTRLMQNEVDALRQAGVEVDAMATALFSEGVSVFARRSLTLKRRLSPQIDFVAGYTYDDDAYTITDSAVDQFADHLLGETPDELVAFMGANRQLYHQVDDQQSQEFIEVLKILGFRS